LIRRSPCLVMGVRNRTGIAGAGATDLDKDGAHDARLVIDVSFKDVLGSMFPDAFVFALVRSSVSSSFHGMDYYRKDLAGARIANRKMHG
jgi:hypothetical protein